MLRPRGTQAVPRFSHGFSLIELMVTVSIMVILVTAVAPGASEWLANLRLRGAAEAALAGLQKARAEAIKRNQVVTFWLVSPANVASLDNSCDLSSTSPSWVISLDSPAGQCASATSATIAPRIVEAHGAGSATTGIEVAALTQVDPVAGPAQPATQVAFDAFGQTLNPAASIRTIDFTSPTAGTRHLRMQISLAGAVRMCDRDVAAPDPMTC